MSGDNQTEKTGCKPVLAMCFFSSFWAKKGLGTSAESGIPQPPKVIFDCTYLTEADYLLAKNYLQNNLTASQLERVVEINVKIK